MRLNIFNMGFGDCFLLQEDNKNLLVDFGSDFMNTNQLQAVATNIVGLCPQQNLSILLTHFHNDHINGLLQTSLCQQTNVDTIYIPDIFTQTPSNNSISYVQLSLLSNVFQSIRLKQRPSITLYNLLQTIMKTNSKLLFLKRGDSFLLSETTFEVLWPCFHTLKVNQKVQNRIIKALTTLNFSQNLNMAITSNTVSLGIVDELGNLLSAAFQNLASGFEINNPAMNELEEKYEQLSDQCSAIFNSLTKNQINSLTSLAQSMVNEENRISIVFQDETIQKCSKLLMTGDITKTEFKKILQGTLKSNTALTINQAFKVIKAPHHATRSHFLPILPPCEKIIAANGDTKHPHWGKIYYEYGSFYGNNRNCQMLCTNPRCELRDLAVKGHAHPCKNCSTNTLSSYIINL